VDPFIVVGLGNPGAEYDGTRHNVGFAVIDVLCTKLRAHLKPGKGEYWGGRGRIGEREILLAKPTTYMNNSGIAVEELLHATGSSVENLLIIADDFALPLGTLRVRARGSDGGHNGLASIIGQLGTMEFPRLRCGIGQQATPAGKEKADFVLSPFTAEELKAVDAMIVQAANIVCECVTGGIIRAMNRSNVRLSDPGTGNTQEF
jgi:PTH1 family peptidyl-tRNA hydrolase